MRKWPANCEWCGKGIRSVYPVVLDKALKPGRIDAVMSPEQAFDGSQPVYVDRPPPYDYRKACRECVDSGRVRDPLVA